MKIDKNIANLIAELEYEIGKRCYNPNSYDGYTCQEGLAFRYPIYFSEKDDDENAKEYKIRGRIENLRPDQIETMKYKFGSNHLFIGSALLEILELLEAKYNIDFNNLDKSK